MLPLQIVHCTTNKSLLQGSVALLRYVNTYNGFPENVFVVSHRAFRQNFRLGSEYVYYCPVERHKVPRCTLLPDTFFKREKKERLFVCK